MKTGEVWQVNFPYEDDSTQSKIRPCVILDVDDESLEVLAIKVTTHEPRDEFDVPIFKWNKVNLLEPSFARVSKSEIILKKDFIKRFGELDIIDFNNIAKKFRKFHS